MRSAFRLDISMIQVLVCEDEIYSTKEGTMSNSAVRFRVHLLHLLRDTYGQDEMRDDIYSYQLDALDDIISRADNQEQAQDEVVRQLRAPFPQTEDYMGVRVVSLHPRFQ